MKNFIYFILCIVVALLSIKFIEFDVSYVQGVSLVIAIYVYAILLFKKGYSLRKLVFGSLALLLVLIVLAFVVKMNIGGYSILLFLVFYAEAMQKRKETINL
ncbi:hypothetical protein SAMN04487943_11568 [Gracilibacillus orientalis]|uniref:Uncharacterized protein n=1 Tax=Gracilibacillus orientalis TaxID=334253 RepID=A0A1I4QB64_9BACI|nr:hypothetical protein [Gracilibacillus orientalis]SFM37274.1 hypothetical protein SAMN04487943_11568 [Gracilibacillus orientalis]